MRKLTLFLYFLIFTLAGFSQQKLSGLVEDDETGDPVSFASITDREGEGQMTDSTGKFSLLIRKQSKLKDSIVISAIGYASRKIALKDLLSNNTVKLSQADKMLEQVKVYASLKGDHRKFGYYREWKVKNEGGEIGYIFDLPRNKVQIGQVHVKINHNYDTCWLKLHLRDAAMTGLSLPENEVLKKEIIIPATIKYGLVEFDLGYEQFSLPTRRLYVGFELLRCGCSQSTAPSFFFMGNEEGLNFYRESEKSIWKKGGEHTIYVRMITK